MLPINPRARGLIFDMDGTLADTMPIHFKAWAAAGRKHGFVYPEEMFYANAGTPSADIVRIVNRTFGKSLDPEFISREKEAAFLSMIDVVKPLDPIFDIVKRCHGRIPMAIGTGEYRIVADRVIQAIGADRYIPIVVYADEVSRPKPDPETFLKCAERMGVAPEFCEVFEDGEPGLEAARRAGMMRTDVREALRTASGTRSA